MRNTLTALVLLALSGCASAPKPAECKGEFRPVNVADRKEAVANQSTKIVKCNEGSLYGHKG